MAHIRVVVFEIDQPDQACFDAIQNLIGSPEKTPIQLIQTPSPTPHKYVGNKPGRTPKVSATSDPIQPTTAPEEFGRTGTLLRKILGNGPKTTLEMIEASKLTPASVYTWLSNNRKGGSIETKKDENGTMKNYLVR